MRDLPQRGRPQVLRGTLKFDDILPEPPDNIGELMQKCPSILDHLEIEEIQDYIGSMVKMIRGHLPQHEFDDKPQTKRYVEANAKLEQETLAHRRKLERDHQIEWCQWSVAHDGTERIWVTCRSDAPDRTYSKEDINLFLLNPTSMYQIPGWEYTTPLQREAVVKALWEALEEMG